MPACPPAADHVATRGIEIESIVLNALEGLDTPVTRAAAARALCQSAPVLARLDSDTEAALGLFTDEFADQMGQAMALREKLRVGGKPMLRREYEAEVFRVKFQLGAILFDVFAAEIDERINTLIDDHAIPEPGRRVA